MLLKYIGRRLLYSLPGLIGITIIIFLALRILPGRPSRHPLWRGGPREPDGC